MSNVPSKKPPVSTSYTGEAEPVTKTSHEHLSILGLIGSVMFGLVLAVVTVNMALTALLSGTIFPNVEVAGRSLAWKTRPQAMRSLEAIDTPRRLHLAIGDKEITTTSTDLGAKRDLNTTIEAAYGVGRQTPWPILGVLSIKKDGNLGYSYQVDTAKLSLFANKIVADVGKAPIDAQISFVNGELVAVPDQDGLTVDQSLLGDMLQKALTRDKDQSVSLVPSKVPATISLAEAQSTLQSAKDLASKSITLRYQDKVFQPDSKTVASWLTFPVATGLEGKKALTIVVDSARVNGYVQTIANQVGIAPVNKKVTVKNGVSSVDQEGQDGTAIDQDQAAAALVAALSAKQPLDYTVTSHQVAFKTQYNRVTTLDGVARYIEINLSSQHLWVYQDNQVIYESPVTSGATYYGFPTVTGLFNIYYKTTNTRLIGRQYGPDYNYDVAVKYWMPFYQGFGLHDASWRSNFGGQDYYYTGSHGCVNLPDATAAFIYNWADIGTPVWVHA